MSSFATIYRVVLDIDPELQEVRVHVHARVPADQTNLAEVARALDAARDLLINGPPELVRYTN